jgi:Uma2 family endonuclease
MAIVWRMRRFTVPEYHRMGEAGILHDDERVELLDGEIVEMTPIGPRHASVVDRMTRLFSRLVGERAVVRIQSPIALAVLASEPQPDLALLKPRADFYAAAHPTSDDVLLVSEVLDASPERDRRLKLPLYAGATIREVWLVDLGAERIEVYRQPAPDGYRETRLLRRGESTAVETLPDLAIRVDDILG